MSDDFDTPEWQSFGADLIRQRREAVRTRSASASFVDRMTSSVADPEAARGTPAAEQPSDGAPPPSPRGE